VELSDRRGKVIAELEHADAQSGITHRFELRQRQIEQAGIADAIVGTKILVSLQPDRSKKRRRLNLKSAEARALAKSYGQLLTLENDVASPNSEMLPASLIIDLVGAGVNADEAWAFYKESFHLRVDTVLPFRPFDTVSVPARLIPVLRQRRRELEQRWHVEIAIRGGDGVLDLVGESAKTVASAVAAINTIAQAPHVSVQTDGTSTRRLRENVEAHSDIDFVWLDENTNIVMIVGRSRTAVEGAVRELLKPAVGILTLAIGKKGYPVGRGQDINALCDLTGCHGTRSTDGQWTIRASSEANLKTFFAYATERIRGSSARIIDRGSLKFLDERDSTDDSRARKPGDQDAQAGKNKANAGNASPRAAKWSTPRPLSAPDERITTDPTVQQNRRSDNRPSRQDSPREIPAAQESKGLLKSIFSFLRKGK
jgi:hypothetical protein